MVKLPGAGRAAVVELTRDALPDVAVAVVATVAVVAIVVVGAVVAFESVVADVGADVVSVEFASVPFEIVTFLPVTNELDS